MTASINVLRHFGPAHLIASAGLVAAMIVYLLRPAGLDQQGATVAALAIFVIAFWATNVLPPYFTGLIFLFLVVLTQAAPPDVAFSGFASQAFWLVFGGLIIGAAFNHTGLAERFAQRVTGRLAGSYPVLIAGLVTLSVVLVFLLPSSMGRIVLLTPIMVAVARRLGFQPGSNGFAGIVMTAIFASYLPSYTVLSSNVPNMILAGTAESTQDYVVSYGEYLLLHFPVLGLLKSIAIAVLILYLFPARINSEPEPARWMEPLSGAEKRLLLILLAALSLWLTDTLHGVSAAWVAMGAGLLIIAPGIGVLPQEKMRSEINYTLLFFVASIISLGEVIAGSALSDLLADFISGVLPFTPGADFGNFLLLTGAAELVCLTGTAPTVPALLTPLADELAAVTGLSLGSVLLTQPIGFGLVIFPYQAPPLVVGTLMSGTSLRSVMRLNLAVVAVTVLLLIPLDYLWWELLGWL